MDLVAQRPALLKDEGTPPGSVLTFPRRTNVSSTRSTPLNVCQAGCPSSHQDRQCKIAVKRFGAIIHRMSLCYVNIKVFATFVSEGVKLTKTKDIVDRILVSY